MLDIQIYEQIYEAFSDFKQMYLHHNVLEYLGISFVIAKYIVPYKKC